MKRQLSVNSYQLSVISKLKLFTVYCLLFTVFIGCQQGGAPSQPQAPAASQTKKEAPKPAATLPAEEVKAEKKEAAAVDVKQKNPFKPFIAKATDKPAVVVPKMPLQKYELEQLKLVAIMWGMNGSIAMVEAPDGKGYSVKKGDLIGNKDGRVKRIDKDRVVVEEKFTEAGGETTSSEFEIKLPLPKGEEEVR